jgi:hypothetical protein
LSLDDCTIFRDIFAELTNPSHILCFHDLLALSSSFISRGDAFRDAFCSVSPIASLFASIPETDELSELGYLVSCLLQGRDPAQTEAVLSSFEWEFLLPAFESGNSNLYHDACQFAWAIFTASPEMIQREGAPKILGHLMVSVEEGGFRRKAHSLLPLCKMVQLADRVIVEIIVNNRFIENVVEFLGAGESVKVVLMALNAILAFAEDPELCIFERLEDCEVLETCVKIADAEDKDIAVLAGALLEAHEKWISQREISVW